MPPPTISLCTGIVGVAEILSPLFLQVRHVLTKLYGEEASKASPPLRMLEPHELVDYIWTGKDSVVGELLQCMAVHSPEGLADLTRQIQDHNPPPGGDIEENLRRSLLW